MPKLRSIGLTGVGAWGVWYFLVLRHAARQTTPWGPEWLAVKLSGILYNFGCWYLRFSHNSEEAMKAGILDAGKQRMLVWHPHGAFTIAALYFISHFWASNYPGGVRGKRFVCVAPLLLRIPLVAEFLLLCHARSADTNTFNSLLAKGATVAIQPGGLLEQVQTDETKEKVFFPPRLGFIRLAIKHGVPLLPAYAFGENQLYRTANWVRKLNHFFYRTFKTGNLLVLGQGSIPNSPIFPNPLMLPIFRRGLHFRWGEPVDVGPPDANPSDSKVQEVFERYVQALQKVFNSEKDRLLPKNVAAQGLEVMWSGGEKDPSTGAIAGTDGHLPSAKL